jgi:hypothetical protein
VTLAFLLLLGAGAVLAWALVLGNRQAEPAPLARDSVDSVVVPAQPPLGPLAGDLTLKVWTKGEGGKRGLPVQDWAALPVRDGELIHIEVKLNRKAHVYLVWVDARGSVDPLYPWDREKGALSDPPPVLPPAAQVHSPPEWNGGWPMEGPSGLETVLLLARETPLPAAVNLARILDRIPPSPLRNLREVAVRGYDRDRAIAPFDQLRGPAKKAQEIDDPLLQMMERVRRHFDVVRAVRFAHQK